MNRIVATLFVALGLIAAGPRVAQADTLDCTSGSCASGSGIEFSFGGANFASFAGALWSVTTIQPTGSGVIDSFVRISGNTDVVDGLNTTERPLANDENSSPTFTHDLVKSAIGTVTLPNLTNTGTQDYYAFLLDINQTGSDPLLSMSQVKICTGPAMQESVADTCLVNGATLRYNMDSPVAGTGDNGNNVLMDYRLNNGSGSGDLFMYIPTSYLNFNGNNNKNVYLWSQFGLPSPDGNNDGYEEWAVRVQPGTGSPSPFNTTPEPASLVLLGSGLVAGTGFLRRSRKKAAAQKLT